LSQLWGDGAVDCALEEEEPGDGTMTDDFLFLDYKIMGIMDAGVLHNEKGKMGNTVIKKKSRGSEQ
jgi:hypothetical protein